MEHRTGDSEADAWPRWLSSEKFRLLMPEILLLDLWLVSLLGRRMIVSIFSLNLKLLINKTLKAGLH